MTGSPNPSPIRTPASASAPDAPRGRDPPARAPAILLVDDEPDILDSLQLLLGRSSLAPRVLTASSGAEGLQVLGREPVDLVVSDFKMPGMDGIQFLVAARELRPGVHRVLFTAYADAELARRAQAEAGLTAFLSKTMDPRELLRTLESLLAEAAAALPGAAPA